MVTNPCPRCSYQRPTLEADCTKCGWTLDTPQTSPAAAADQPGNFLARFVGWAIVLAACHGLALWLCIINLFNNVWAVYTIFVLVFPLGYLASVAKFGAVFAWACVVANSVLWGIAGSAMITAVKSLLSRASAGNSGR